MSTDELLQTMYYTHCTWLYVCFNGDSIDAMSDELSVDAGRHCCRLLPTESYDLPHVTPVVSQLGWYVVQEWSVRFLQPTNLTLNMLEVMCVPYTYQPRGQVSVGLLDTQAGVQGCPAYACYVAAKPLYDTSRKDLPRHVELHA